jgi:hypothetical protein
MESFSCIQEEPKVKKFSTQSNKGKVDLGMDKNQILGAEAKTEKKENHGLHEDLATPEEKPSGKPAAIGATRPRSAGGRHPGSCLLLA